MQTTLVKAADIGLVGLAVMGQNLVLNMNDHGYTVAVHNRTVAKVDEFLNGPARGTRVVGAHSLTELAAALKPPRKVMLIVKAGKPVDDFIDRLLPHLAPGDLIIDGGYSQFADKSRRTKNLATKGMLYIGTGISGGEQGARGWARRCRTGSRRSSSWRASLALEPLLVSLPALLRGLLLDGVWAGIGTVAAFVPLIVVFFFFLAAVEDSGYLSRAAFLTDAFMARLGLDGRAFLMLLMGFGCNVPALMGTRVMRDRPMRLCPCSRSRCRCARRGCRSSCLSPPPCSRRGTRRGSCSGCTWRASWPSWSPR